MKKIIGSGLVAAFLLCGQMHAQEVVQGIATGAEIPAVKPPKGLNVHAAFTYAVVNNRYEVKGQYKPGINFGLVYRFGQWFALEGTFSRHKRHNATSLDDIQSWTADFNAVLSMRVAKSDLYFRTVFGGGYVDWKGYYVGPNLNDNYHYYYGKLLNDRFYSANMGCGFSHYFMRQRLEGFGDFRMRWGADKRVVFAIIDTQFQFGLRYSLRSQEKQKEKDASATRKTNNDKRRRVYKWMKDR